MSQGPDWGRVGCGDNAWFCGVPVCTFDQKMPRLGPPFCEELHSKSVKGRVGSLHCYLVYPDAHWPHSCPRPLAQPTRHMEDGLGSPSQCAPGATFNHDGCGLEGKGPACSGAGGVRPRRVGVRTRGPQQGDVPSCLRQCPA